MTNASLMQNTVLTSIICSTYSIPCILVQSKYMYSNGRVFLRPIDICSDKWKGKEGKDHKQRYK